MTQQATELIAQQYINGAANAKTWADILYNVKASGAKGDGVVDDTAAIQATINAALLVKGTVYFPPGTYKVTSQLTVSGSGFITLLGAGGRTQQSKIIATLASGNVFEVTASYLVKFQDLYISNSGTTGRCISFSSGESHTVTNCSLENVLGNASDMIYFQGANTRIVDCGFTNNHQYAYCIQCYCKAGILNINSYIISNIMGGNGKGILVDADTTTRTEGLKILSNSMILTSTEQITIKSILHVDICDNMLDQSSLYTIFLNPTGAGINGLYIGNNYISTAQSQLEGIAIYAPNVATGVTNVSISDNMIAYSGYGIVANANASNWSVRGNAYTNINHEAITFIQSSNIIITGNPRIAGGNSISLTDGASGGPFLIKDNVVVGPVLRTITNAAKFIFKDNIGYVTNSWGNKVFPTTALGTQYVAIPHGLVAAPNLNKCTVNINQNGQAAEYGGAWIISADATIVTVGIKVTVVGAGNSIATIYAEI